MYFSFAAFQELSLQVLDCSIPIEVLRPKITQATYMLEKKNREDLAVVLLEAYINQGVIHHYQ